jgi:hypothetical protein
MPKEGEMETMKKVVMVGLIWTVMVFSTAVWAQPNLQIGSGSGAPGAAVTIPVTFTNNGSVAALQFDLQYSSAVFAVGSLTSGTALSPHLLYSSTPSSGLLRVVIIPPVVSPLPATHTGVLVNIPVTISASANLGSYALSISNPSVVFSDGAASSISPGTLSHGQVTVQAPGVPEMVVERVLLQENFSSWIPESWFVAGAWGGDCEGGRSIDPPFEAPWAIVDSSCALTSDERLYAPIFDASSCSTVTLRMSSQFDHGIDGAASIALSDDYGETWTDAMTMTNNAGPETKEINISAVAGKEEALIGFGYASPDKTLGDGFWAIDNVEVLCQPAGLQFKAPYNVASTPQTLMIRNKGNLDLNIDHITLTGDTGFNLQNDHDHCTGQTVHPEGKCTVDVVFAPLDGSTKTATLSFSSNDPGAPNITLSGKGVQFLVEPDEGWIGTEIALTGSGFGTKKGSVLLGTTALKVLDWQSDLIHALLSKTIPPGPYDVTVKPKEPKGTPWLVEDQAFTVIPSENPRIFWISPERGVVGTEVTVKGMFFGSKGSLYLEYEGSKGPMKKKCKVLKWTMNSLSGDSEVVFVVPLISAGAADVVVAPTAPVSEVREENGFTMMAPEIGSVNPIGGKPGDQIEIRGHFFGAKKGKVYLGGYEVKGKPAQKSCAVTSWGVDPSTGEDVVVFIVPGGLASGPYDLIVTNSVGSDTELRSFTID